ncbi:MAG: TetR/AcrR family transcriptional regulator [Pseudomonadota bacterium]
MAKDTYHHGSLREALLDAAEDDLRQSPEAVPSVRSLAAKLGVSSTAPQAHFRTKSDLMTALAVRGFERLSAALSETETLRGLAEAYIGFAQDNLGIYRLMFSTGTRLDGDQQLREVSRTAYDTLRAEIARLFPNATERERNERTLAAWAVVHGLATLASEGRLSSEAADDTRPATLARIAADMVGGVTETA